MQRVLDSFGAVYGLVLIFLVALLALGISAKQLLLHPSHKSWREAQPVISFASYFLLLIACGLVSIFIMMPLEKVKEWWT